MQKQNCGTCQSEKTHLRCGVCEDPTCKHCAHLLDEDAFSFMPVIADELTKGVYCNVCFNNHVAATSDEYKNIMKLAGNIDVFYKEQGKESRLAKRLEDPIHIKNCEDRDELIMRLAFQTAQRGFNTVVDVEISTEKLQSGSHKKTIFHGHGIPTNMLPRQIIKNRAFWDN